MEKNIMICIPCMDSVPAQFCSSLAMLEKVGNCVINMQLGSLIYNARNDLAKKAIQMGATHVLWLDSDMVFSPNTLKKLLDNREGDIITGLYYRRVSPYTPVVFDQLELGDNGAKWSNFVEIPTETFEVGGCGFGCVLMPTDVLISVFQNYGTCFNPLNGLGEDLAFCWRARKCGYKIVCDPSVKLGHIGHVVITEDFYKAYRGALNDRIISES